jgi:hypothetical protein
VGSRAQGAATAWVLEVICSSVLSHWVHQDQLYNALQRGCVSRPIPWTVFAMGAAAAVAKLCHASGDYASTLRTAALH